MRIQVDSKTIITSDSKCWMICSPSKNKITGELKWGPDYYFNDFAQCLKFLTNMKIRQLECTSFAEAIAGAEKVAAELSSVFNVTINVGKP